MKIFRDKTDYDGMVVALGNFDGLHIAHMTIIRNGIKYAKENGLKSGVLLFEENTNDVVGHKIELITPNEAKLELLEREKPDFVYMEKFDKEFMKKTPEEFVLTVSVLRTVPSSLAKRYVTEEKSSHSLFLVRLI